MFTKKCHINCFDCKDLNIKTDGNDYPYEYECLRYSTAIDLASISFDKNEFIFKQMNGAQK